MCALPAAWLCKGAQVTVEGETLAVLLLCVLAGSCKLSTELQRSLNAFVNRKNDENQAFLSAVAAPVTSFRQCFDGASTHSALQTMNQSFC